MQTALYEIGLSSTINGREENQDCGLAFIIKNNIIQFYSTEAEFHNTTYRLHGNQKYSSGSILCDGLHPNGKIASKKMIELCKEIIEYHTTSTNTPFERFNMRAYSRIKNIEHAATTVLIALCDTNHQLHCGYIGDTRLYLNKTTPMGIHLLTRDHNYQRQIVEEEAGISTLQDPLGVDFWDDPNQTEYIQFPKSGLIPATCRLTKSMGYLIRNELDVTIFEIENPIIIEPNESIMLLTDGAYDAFRNKRKNLQSIISDETPQKCADIITRLAPEVTDDNASAIIIKRVQ